MARRVPVHYLRRNHADRTPAAVIFWDTETRTIPTDRGDVLALRLWGARYIDRRPPSKTKPRAEAGAGRTSAELAAWIEHQTRGRRSVWAYAHNLGFDLVTTRLPLVLAGRGWTITDAAIGGKSPWLRLSNGKCVLTLADSGSWLPYPLDQVGEYVGIVKPPLPAEDDGPATWAHRCAADVNILTAAMLTLMGWWDREKLGRWTITGSASGWNTMRHMLGPDRITIDPDPDAVARDRQAVHSGRRGVWTIGEHTAGPFHELDLTAAYPTVAATLPLPAGRAYIAEHLADDDPVWDSDRWGVLADAVIDTDVPRWPVHVDGRIWYPVGRFATTLAGPDLQAARNLGCLVAASNCHVHQLSTALAPWARWVLAVQSGQVPGTPVIAMKAAKSWGRSVIGKWSARAFERVQLGPAVHPGWHVEPGWDHDHQVPGTLLDLAGTRWWVAETGTPDNAYPAITAWTEAYVRVRLSRVIEAVGDGAVLQANTDGLIVAERTIGTTAAHGSLIAPDGMSGPARLSWVLDRLQPLCAPLNMRVKSTRGHVTVLGPQHVKLDGQRSFAGIPRNAAEQPDGSYLATQWPGIDWQLEHGDPRGFMLRQRVMRADGPYPTGWITDDRRVVPIETHLDRDGRTAITPWHSTRWHARGLRLADVQHPTLDALSW